MTAQLPLFEAMITPHRSMGAAGLRRVAMLLFSLSALVAVGLWFAGAWPVIGFTGLESVLAVILLARNARARSASELVLLTEDGLQVIRTDVRGRRSEARLQAAWLRAGLRERPGRTPALLVQDRHQRIEIGAELGEDEKRSLAETLREALYRQRHPRFDNPQLRDA